MEEATGITPQALLSRPLLDDRLMFFYAEFLTVARSRMYSEGGGPYPLQCRAFLDHCEIYEIERESRGWLWSGIKLLDDAWLALSSAKMKAETAAAKSK